MAGDDRTTSTGNVSTVRSFFRLLAAKDIDAWIELWAPDAEQVYPFGAEMFPARVTGRDAIRARWCGRVDAFDSLSFAAAETWADGNGVVARFDVDHVLRDGNHYRNKYVGIFKFTDTGEIREYWEYFDPIVAGVAFGLAEITYH